MHILRLVSRNIQGIICEVSKKRPYSQGRFQGFSLLTVAETAQFGPISNSLEARERNSGALS